MSPKNKEYISWMLAITLIAAFVGFVLVNPGPISRATPTAVHSTRGAPSKAAPATQIAQPQNGTPTATSNQATPPRTNPRAGLPSAYMQAHELFELMDTKPEAISSVTLMNGSDQVVVFKNGDSVKYFVTLPEQGGRQELLKTLREKKVAFKVEEDSTSTLRNFAFSFGPLLLMGLIALFIFGRNRAGAGMSGRMGFGKSRAKRADDENANLRKVTFDDVAGCDEAVRELRRVAKGLRRRRLYRFFGAKLPKGVIFEGPPGNGKTLLARALAGECDGGFAATSGSDFVEMFVGVGASRVRDMFEEGRKYVKETGKPYIIFIDEIDAIGGKRGGGNEGGGSNSEREQTLNAILVEMDGMKDNEGLIIVAATNRIDMLDDALLRPGRFDCQLTVDKPNKEGRVKIFGIHTRNKPLAADVTCEALANRTYGYSGAEIEGATNRAALIAAERHGEHLPEDADEKTIEETLKKLGAVIEMSDFDEGIDFVRYGATNSSRQKGMSKDDKRNTTVHEAGHAIASAAMPGSDPIVKITMVNRSRALGYVQNMPGEDRYGLDFEQIVARIVCAMAGRAAQELILGKMDTGASNDFEQGSQLAYNMVTAWGMSRVGIISVGKRGAPAMRGMGGGPVSNYGPKLADEIDDEWRRIVADCYAMAYRIVETDRERLEKLVAKLGEEETILADGWEKFAKDNPSKVDPKSLVLDIKPVRKGN